jgi:hypothetical protein
MCRGGSPSKQPHPAPQRIILIVLGKLALLRLFSIQSLDASCWKLPPESHGESGSKIYSMSSRT